jgi:hypothetical protein
MKRLKFPRDYKAFDTLDKRLRSIEYEINNDDDEEETESQKIRKCAQLRHARVMKLVEIMGYNEALSWQRDGISQYELNCELTPSLEYTPERRYQNFKERWLWHPSSWFMRRFTTFPPLTDYDGLGCNENGCIPECRFYEPIGRIEDDEYRKLKEKEHQKEQELIQAKYRLLGFNDDDTDETKKQKWDEIHKVKSGILKQTSEYLEQRQHSWQSCEDLKAIEDAAWAEFYKSKNTN